MREQLVTSAAQTYGGTNRCTSITVHETANQSRGAGAQAHANLQSNGNVRQASWHITVDDTEAIRSYSDTAQCWHAGTREGAESSIAVEICVNSDSDYDAAFKRAAEVVASLRAKHGIPSSKVYDHAHWTGKDCPTVMRATGRWQEFLNLTDPSPQEAPVTRYSSPVPVGARFTSGFSKARTLNGATAPHLGDDWAPTIAGVSAPITAPADGIVTAAGTGVLAWHSGRIVIIDHGKLKDKYGSDHMVSNFGHLKSITVKVGDRVKAGQIIGWMGATGNVTGMHLHGGMRCNGEWISFRDWLNRKGVFPGRTAPLTVGSVQPVATPAPATKPTVMPKPSSSVNSRADNIAIEKALNAMGINVGLANGVDGPMQKAGVKVFQRAHGLVDDGVWGAKTQAVFVENRSVQNAIKRMKGVPDNWKSDGFIGATSKKWIKYTNERQGWGTGSTVNDQLIRNLKAAKAW
ncbi:peptidoglycan DD-metalloendopeptidase family protein [Paeniglutamicibacter terrestris]|uniref:Peptidoglycan DD-metalloendopeptidase family protein n=1 Tax=Paeniglutamicibacter terrestris TaxID=2723403 RepID=A0ABX1G7D9_9MICC|nr:peptidoglycan DD-metalloendopeptidase family protein [Paeniglutamicibacter terrestris]NKG22188.1 peptidoglycan DD-metalloendopeptidase family protein [Paeniglutamicibacter terrestris]